MTMGRRSHRQHLVAALVTALWTTSCAPQASYRAVDVALQPRPAASPKALVPCGESERAEIRSSRLKTLAEPQGIWIRDQWGGLGTTYSLEAHLLRLADTYDADCTLSVSPYQGGPLDIPTRFEHQYLTIPAAKVRALVDALKGARLSIEENGLVELSPLDDNGEGEMLMFAKAGGAPLYLHLGPVSSMTVDLDGHYRIQDAKAARAAYRAVVDSLGLEEWIRAATDRAVSAARAHP